MSQLGARQLVFETLEPLRLIVSYQAPLAPSDREWDDWLAAVPQLWSRVGPCRLLVVSDGGYPSIRQLERLRAKKKLEPLTSVIAVSSTFRFVTSSLTFFNAKIRCFSPGRRTSAFKHLELSPEGGRVAEQALERLRMRIGAYA